MTTQQLEQKFSLIGDPIVRAVVRHLCEPEFEEPMLEIVNNAGGVLSHSFNWSNETLGLDFWYTLRQNLNGNPNYAFTTEELKQVKNAYPELFNADGSLKADSVKTTHDTNAPRIYDELQVGSPVTKAELNRNEVALKIMCSYINSGSRNVNNNMINTAFNLADAFIKQSKIQ